MERLTALDQVYTPEQTNRLVQLWDNERFCRHFESVLAVRNGTEFVIHPKLSDGSQPEIAVDRPFVKMVRFACASIYTELSREGLKEAADQVVSNVKQIPENVVPIY